MSIDVHNHVMPEEALDLLGHDESYGVSLEGGMWTGAHHVPFPVVESFFDPARKLDHLDEKGVDTAVVSPPPPLFFYDCGIGAGEAFCEADNEGMARFCSHRPDRLYWLANLPLQDPDIAAQTFRKAVRAGAVGAAVGTSVAGRRLDEPEFEPLWAAADEVGQPVLVHPAFNERHPALEDWYLQNVIGNPLETTVLVERLICAGVLSRHRRVRLVLLHGGGFLPYQAGRLAHACGVRPELTIEAEDVWKAFEQLHFDTITHDIAALRYLVERVGVEHVVLGTDMPFDMAMQSPMETLAKAFEPATIQVLAEDNPARLFGIARPTSPIRA